MQKSMSALFPILSGGVQMRGNFENTDRFQENRSFRRYFFSENENCSCVNQAGFYNVLYG